MTLLLSCSMEWDCLRSLNEFSTFKKCS
jgi:hypothetical protein